MVCVCVGLVVGCVGTGGGQIGRFVVVGNWATPTGNVPMVRPNLEQIVDLIQMIHTEQVIDG